VALQFKKLLSGSPELRSLTARAQSLSALQRHLMAVAPPHFAQSSQVLSLQQGTLNVAVANATVAAKLRQLAPELVLMLQNRGCEVSGIRVRVQVIAPPVQPRHTPRKLSKAARDALNQLSADLDESPLRHALEKITGNKG
jgi:hypothetical protein